MTRMILPFLLIPASVGLTLILTHGVIFNIPRKWIASKSEVISHFVGCSQCVGFWSGLLIGLLYILSFPVLHWYSLLLPLFLGFASSFASQLSDLIIALIDAHVALLDKKYEMNKTLLTEGRKIMDKPKVE